MRFFVLVVSAFLCSSPFCAVQLSAQASRAVPPGLQTGSGQVVPGAASPVSPRTDSAPLDGDRFVPDDELKAAADAERRLPVPARAVSSGALGVTQVNAMGIPPGQIVVEVSRRRLLYAIDAKSVRIYPVAVGKSGAQWRGTVVVGRMSTSPGWHPTKGQRRRRRLPVYVAPGRSNPLGVRAIYLFRGGRDTLLRIHGTNEPRSIGHAVSSGCIRMRNADVVDLYSKVHVGTVVTAR